MRRASLRSVLLICAFNTACMCRVSTQITGNPASARALNSHCDNGPASNPIRLKRWARFFSTANKASGSLATFTSRTILPASSTMQMLVSLTETSSPLMDISARAISLPDRPQWAIWVTSVRMRREDRSSISFLSSRRPRRVRCFDISRRSGDLNPARLECSTASQDAPSNAGELVGERDGEDVVMQPLLGRFEPRLEPVAIPALRLDKYDPRGLNE